MVHEKVIEDLKDFDNWKDFKYYSNYIEEKNIEKVLSKDFEDGKIWSIFVKQLHKHSYLLSLITSWNSNRLHTGSIPVGCTRTGVLWHK